MRFFMSDFSYQPFGNKSFYLEFKCDKCNADVKSEEIWIGEPTYSADNASDSQSESEGFAYCPECDEEYTVDVYVDMYSGSGSIRDFSNGDIEVIENQEDPPEDYYEDLYWDVTLSKQLDIFKNHIDSSKNLLNSQSQITINNEFSLYVMLYGYIVSAMEGYLASTFIYKTINSEHHIQKLIQTDATFAKTKVRIDNTDSENIKKKVVQYLKSLIFHRMEKIKPMYKSVLNVDFGDISWLFKAVLKRHDCVHRAGYDKDGKKIEISHDDLDNLIQNCNGLAEIINTSLNNI